MAAASSKSAAASLELLARLGDELRRAQEATDVAPVEPARPEYPQHHRPRLVEASARLGELGYGDGDGDGGRLALFRREAGLGPATRGALGLDDALWEALEELRGFAGAIDPRRWRGADAQWLPAMCRAIQARVVDLGGAAAKAGAGAIAFADLDDDEGAAPPTPDEADASLRGFTAAIDGALAADPDAAACALFDDEALRARVGSGAGEALSFAGDDGLATLRARLLGRDLATFEVDDDERLARELREAVDEGDDAILSFGGGARDRLDALFRDLVDDPALREVPAPADARAHLSAITEAIAEAVDDVDARWSEFLGDTRGVWRGNRRSQAWIHGAATWFEARGEDLAGGLKSVLRGGRGIFGRSLRGEVRAAMTTTLRVAYHTLADVFAGAHQAIAILVDFIRGPTSEGGTSPIHLDRRAGDLRLVVAPAAALADLDAYIAGLRRGDQRLLAAAELLGLLLGIVGAWVGGPLAASTVILTLLGKAPRILELSAALADPAA